MRRSDDDRETLLDWLFVWLVSGARLRDVVVAWWRDWREPGYSDALTDRGATTARKGTTGERQMADANVQLGDEARDTVSGFTGVCVARTEWLNGCWRMTLQPRMLDKDGKPCETQTFDDFQLEVTVPKQQPVGSKETGGPRDAPTRARDPARL